MRRDESQAGFSLLEALISMTIFVSLLAAVLITYSSSRELFTRSERTIEIQQHVRWAMGEITREIRMAGYFPENFATPAASPLLTDPVRIATNGALAVYGDADDSGASSVFFYCLQGETLRRSRGPIDSAAAYSCAGGDVLAENVTELRFTFYDGDGVAVPNPPGDSFALDGQLPGDIPNTDTMTQRNQVRRVAIAMTARKQLRLGEEQLYTLTSDARLRNAN